MFAETRAFMAPVASLGKGAYRVYRRNRFVMALDDVVKCVQSELVFDDAPQLGGKRSWELVYVRREIRPQIEDVVIREKDISLSNGSR